MKVIGYNYFYIFIKNIWENGYLCDIIILEGGIRMKKLRNVFIVLIALIIILCSASIIIFRNNIYKANQENISKKINEISSISYDKISLKVNDN